VAAGAGAPTYLEQFIIGVERTVAGEIAQGRSAGRVLSLAEYRQLIAGKSGELFGAAALLGGALFDLGRGEARVRLGRELGALYQQVDDLLDYCPSAGTGKPPLQDYRQHKWTWMMDLAGLDRFGESEAKVVEVMFRPTTDGVSPARRAVTELRRQQERLLRRVRVLSPGDALLRELLSGWVRAAESAVRTQTDALLAAV
jgi:geranylgeranyl pyrophosphate synthase